MNSFFQASAGDIGISRLLDGMSIAQFFNLLGKQRPLECVGMVEVGLLPHFKREGRLVVIVRILWDDSNAIIG